MGKVAVRDGFSGHGAWERKRPRPIAGFSLGVALGPVAPVGPMCGCDPRVTVSRAREEVSKPPPSCQASGACRRGTRWARRGAPHRARPGPPGERRVLTRARCASPWPACHRQLRLEGPRRPRRHGRRRRTPWDSRGTACPDAARSAFPRASPRVGTGWTRLSSPGSGFHRSHVLPLNPTWRGDPGPHTSRPVTCGTCQCRRARPSGRAQTSSGRFLAPPPSARSPARDAACPGPPHGPLRGARPA